MFDALDASADPAAAAETDQSRLYAVRRAAAAPMERAVQATEPRQGQQGQSSAPSSPSRSSQTESEARLQARKHPKAVLQQLAQREGWGAPRFEKLPGGVRGDENPPADIRFQALIDVKPSSNDGRRSRRRGSASTGSCSAPELDGWHTVTEAQDAVSTKALMDLFGGSPAAGRRSSSSGSF